MRRLTLFAPLIVFMALALLFWRGLGMDPNEMPSARIDDPLPQFELPRLDQPDQTITRSELVGKPLLLNVWGSWCISCRVEHPFLMQLAEQGVPIYGVSYKDKPENAQAWLDDLGDPYVANIVDLEGSLGVDLGVFGAPETYVLDAQGVIRYKHVGVVDERVWTEKIAPVLFADGNPDSKPGA